MAHELEAPQCSCWPTLGQVASTQPHESIHRDDDEPQQHLHPSLGHDTQQCERERSLTQDAGDDQNHKTDIEKLQCRRYDLWVFEIVHMPLYHTHTHGIADEGREDEKKDLKLGLARGYKAR